MKCGANTNLLIINYSNNGGKKIDLEDYRKRKIFF